MPRNGSDGTFALADTVAPATLADANEVMTILNDLAAEFTASIAKDGQTPITGQLKGLVSSNPVYSFNSDSDTGFGSDTANEAFIKCGGTKIAKLSAAGLDVLSGALMVAGAQSVPTGVMVPYAGTTAPAGWVLAEGGSIGDASSGADLASTTTQALFTLIWNTANETNGEGQIKDSSGTNTTRGANAAADYAAHKRILLANMANRMPRGKSVSNSHGQAFGNDNALIAQGNLPAVSPTFSGNTVSIGSLSVTVSSVSGPTSTGGVAKGGSGTFGTWGAGGLFEAPSYQTAAGTFSGSGSGSVTIPNFTPAGSISALGSGSLLGIVPLVLVKAFIIKL